MEIRLRGQYPPAEPEKSFSEAVQDLRVKAGVHLAYKGDFFTNPVEVMCGWLESALDDIKDCKLVTGLEDIHVASQAHNSFIQKLQILEDDEELDRGATKLLQEAATDVWRTSRSELVELLKTECSCRIGA